MPMKAEDIESQIQTAMRSRTLHFKQQADALTFEGVRRLLEKDLQLEALALDKHKRFIKQCLSECLEGANNDNSSKNSGDSVEKNDRSFKEEVAESPEKQQTEKDARESSSRDEEKMEDSPVMGLLSGNKTTKSKSVETEGSGKREVPSESTIKKALLKRATYFRANSHEITMAGVRRLLEEDLKLDKNSLDPFKKFISGELDKVLQSPKVPESSARVLEKSSEKISERKMSKKISNKESSDSLGSESEEVEDRVKLKKKVAPKGKVQKSEDIRNRKRPAMEAKMSGKKQKKLAEMKSEENSDEKGGEDSADDHSQSSAEKPVKKKEVSAPAYGEEVEHLKSIIKSCGMSVPPSVYKIAKQAPENKREDSLRKELEKILSREGLDRNPTEKEIKEVRRRKERAKELEGIDMGNIVLSSRRRSTTSFVPPPKPKIPVESDGDEDEDSDNSEDSDEDDNDNDSGVDDGDGSQGEELNEDDESD